MATANTLHETTPEPTQSVNHQEVSPLLSSFERNTVLFGLGFFLLLWLLMIIEWF